MSLVATRQGAIPRILTVVLTIAVLTGCSTVFEQEPPSPGEASKSELVKVQADYDLLAKRPNIDQAMVGYDEMLTALQAALRTEFKLPKWKQFEGRGSSGCGNWVINYDVAEERNLPSRKNAGLSEADWPRAVEILHRFADPLGFTPAPPSRNEPGHRAIQLMDPYDATIYFANNGSFVIGLSSGCHLLPGAVRPTS